MKTLICLGLLGLTVAGVRANDATAQEILDAINAQTAAIKEQTATIREHQPTIIWSPKTGFTDPAYSGIVYSPRR